MVTIGQRRLAQRGRSSWPCACARRDAACDLRSLCVRTRTAVAGPGRRARDLRGTRGRRSSNPTCGSPPCSAAALISRTRVRRPPAVDSTHRPTHLADLIEQAAARHADHPALIDAATGAALTWAEFDSAVSAEARRLAAEGVVAGDRVVIHCGGPALAVAVAGAMRAGAVAVPVAPGEVGRGCRPLRAPGAGGRRAGVRGRHRSRSARSGRARRAAGRGRRGRGPRPAAAHLRRPGRVPVAPRGAGQPGPGSRVASGPGHARGPRVADPAPLPRLRAGSRSVPGLLGRGDRRAARPGRPDGETWPIPSSGIG